LTDLTPNDGYGQRLDLPEMVGRRTLRDGNTHIQLGYVTNANARINI